MRERRARCCKGVSLVVKRGEVVAFVGPSGAGKSSLVNLMPRFFDVSGGSITIDGHDLRDVTIASLRKQIGKVTQETVLFNDTVRNNIAYGQPDVSHGARGGGRAHGAGARLHRAHAGRIRHEDRREGRAAERRRAAAAGDCARDPEERADSDSR